jgi:hypothetical protein
VTCHFSTLAFSDHVSSFTFVSLFWLHLLSLSLHFLAKFVYSKANSSLVKTHFTFHHYQHPTTLHHSLWCTCLPYHLSHPKLALNIYAKSRHHLPSYNQHHPLPFPHLIIFEHWHWSSIIRSIPMPSPPVATSHLIHVLSDTHQKLFSNRPTNYKYSL